MSRINVEDSLFADPRFLLVVEKIGQVNAAGYYLLIARMAQQYWKQGKKLIPKSVWALHDFPKIMIEVGLVNEHKEGFYLKGSERHFKWLVSKIENGRLGGLKSRKNKDEQKQVDSVSYKQAKVSENKPPTPTPTPTPTIKKKSSYLGKKITPVRITELWNILAKQVNFSPVRKLSENRKRKLSKAIEQIPAESEWLSIFKQIPRDGFRLGKNDRMWMANFDWLFRNDNYIKMLEENNED